MTTNQSVPQQLQLFPSYSVTRLGAKQLRFVHNGRYTFIYSYKTPIAMFDTKTNMVFISVRAAAHGYSKTTTRHTNIVRAMFPVQMHKIDERDLLEIAAEVYEITPNWN